MVRSVYSNVGGISENLKTIEDQGDVYAPVPKTTQRAAVAFLNRGKYLIPLPGFLTRMC